MKHLQIDIAVNKFAGGQYRAMTVIAGQAIITQPQFSEVGAVINLFGCIANPNTPSYQNIEMAIEVSLEGYDDVREYVRGVMLENTEQLDEGK